MTDSWWMTCSDMNGQELDSKDIAERKLLSAMENEHCKAQQNLVQDANSSGEYSIRRLEFFCNAMSV